MVVKDKPGTQALGSDRPGLNFLLPSFLAV